MSWVREMIKTEMILLQYFLLWNNKFEIFLLASLDSYLLIITEKWQVPTEFHPEYLLTTLTIKLKQTKIISKANYSNFENRSMK
jgi:hypothetical protein